MLQLSSEQSNVLALFQRTYLLYGDLRERRLANANPDMFTPLPGVNDETVVMWRAEARQGAVGYGPSPQWAGYFRHPLPFEHFNGALEKLLIVGENTPNGGFMATQLSYPTTRYTPDPLIDLSSEEIRKERSPAAARIFFNIMKEWKVKDSDARVLLRDMGNSLFYDLKRNAEGKVLDSERLYRISYLVGIYKGLQILYGEDLGNRFVHLSNTNRMFNGATPLDFMKKGGLLSMQRVRRLLDARRGGV